MWETLRKEKTLIKLRSDKKYGISEEVAKKRIQEYGENVLKDRKKEAGVALEKYINDKKYETED